MKIPILSYALILVLSSCHIEQKKLPNEKKGTLKATRGMQPVAERIYKLDMETAARPPYMQLFKDSLNKRYLTFLNPYNHSIYVYDYDLPKEAAISKITFKQEGPNSQKNVIGYYIKNLDSIYALSKTMEIALGDGRGEILKKMSLNNGRGLDGNPMDWILSVPMYTVNTTIPLTEHKNELLLTGQFTSEIPDSAVNTFPIQSHISFALDSIYFTHHYPYEIFGKDYNWGGWLPMQVYPQLHPDGEQIIYSFTPSHDLYIGDLNHSGEYRKVYAGSNSSGLISSYDQNTNKIESDVLLAKFLEEDRYSAILYDPYRKVYYRFLRRAFPDAPKGTSRRKKDVAVIILDKDFSYLGETTLGPEDLWHWENSFVTAEGLNIEYIDKDDVEEAYITFKVLLPSEIKK